MSLPSSSAGTFASVGTSMALSNPFDVDSSSAVADDGASGWFLAALGIARAPIVSDAPGAIHTRPTSFVAGKVGTATAAGVLDRADGVCSVDAAAEGAVSSHGICIGGAMSAGVAGAGFETAGGAAARGASAGVLDVSSDSIVRDA